MFGPHLMLDCYGCNRKKLEDIKFVYNFLDRFADDIGMHKIMPPYAFSYCGTKPEDWGVSGIILIAESHISVHTFPEKGFVSIDLFSCKEFDVKRAIKYALSEFEAERYESNFLMRGREFPKDIAKAAQI
ncbi:MAG: adenosylmethionine decarboxylase, partial [Candidatus Micrarchaeota archaeon]